MTAAADPLRLAIIVGSTRSGRKSSAVAAWVASGAERRDDIDVEIVDLAEHHLPFFDEPVPPIVGEYLHDHTRAWANVIAAFDGFIFVTPEYNHSVPGVLKNAIDYLFAEWSDKVAGFVTYGVDGGVRAADHLRIVLGELRVADVRTQVSLSLELDFVGYETFKARADHQETLAALFDELVSWGRALRQVRRGFLPPPARSEAIVIRTRVKPADQAGYRAELTALYDELRAAHPSGYQSMTFQVGSDETHYVDVAIGVELPGPVTDLPSFPRFRDGLEDRCEAREAEDVKLIHSYGLG
jgi:NAD(P)H-dependent FMN reductase